MGKGVRDGGGGGRGVALLLGGGGGGGGAGRGGGGGIDNGSGFPEREVSAIGRISDSSGASAACFSSSSRSKLGSAGISSFMGVGGGVPLGGVEGGGGGGGGGGTEGATGGGGGGGGELTGGMGRSALAPCFCSTLKGLRLLKSLPEEEPPDDGGGGGGGGGS